jgi:hypothetical protein
MWAVKEASLISYADGISQLLLCALLYKSVGFNDGLKGLGEAHWSSNLDRRCQGRLSLNRLIIIKVHISLLSHCLVKRAVERISVLCLAAHKSWNRVDETHIEHLFETFVNGADVSKISTGN